MARSSFERAATHFDKLMVPPLRQQLQGRKLFAHSTPLGEGKFEFDYDTITEMGSATVSYDIPDSTVKRDMIEVTQADIKLAVISKGWKIPYTQWKAYLTEGKELRTTAMKSAAQVNGLAEDDLLIQSWKPDGSNARINGLYASAGNTEATSSDFGTFGNAVAEIGRCYAAMYADDVPVRALNWNLVLNDTQYEELDSSYEYGTWEKDKVIKKLNPNPGMAEGIIMSSNDITAGTGMLTPVDTTGDYIDLLIGQDMRNVLGTDSKMGAISPVYATTYEVIAPIVYQADAICTMTGI